MQKNDFIRHWIKFACEKNNVSYLKSKISFRFNSRFSSTLAEAIYPDKQIIFSSSFWNKSIPKQKKEIIIHETCHIISWEKFGPNIKNHGIEWQKCMKICKMVPRKEYVITNIHKKVNCFCSTKKVSNRIFKAIKNGFKMYCPYCNALLKC